MKITISDMAFEKAAEQILQLFFAHHSDIEAQCTIARTADACVVRTAVIVEGARAEAEFAAPADADHRATSDAVKKSVFLACKQLRGDMPTPWGISTGIRPAKTARMMLDDGADDATICASLKHDFWMEEEKAELCLSVAHRERALLRDALPGGVSLYIGIPFCPSRCAYCSFISQAVGHNQKFVAPYVDALLLEMKRTAEVVRTMGWTVETVYFGGGTPTAIPPELLARLLEGLHREFDLSHNRELTVEAGRPDTFSPEMMRVLRAGGVDRLSINPQTMHQVTLDAIGRRHTTEDVVRAFAMAREAGFTSINADLIIGLPGEITPMVEETLAQILALEPEAVTVHTMYLKRAARLNAEFERYRFAKNTAEMMRSALRAVTAYGAAPYYMYKQKNTLGNLENVGLAKVGHACRYNVYIMEETQTVLAMGGGGSTKMIKGDRIDRLFNPKDASDYVARIDEILEKKLRVIDYYKD